VVDSGIVVLFVETIFSDGLACRIAGFLRKGEKRHNRDNQI
jgi:hypothetical protein